MHRWPCVVRSQRAPASVFQAVSGKGFLYEAPWTAFSWCHRSSTLKNGSHDVFNSLNTHSLESRATYVLFFLAVVGFSQQVVT